jgi:hypothetical protein
LGHPHSFDTTFLHKILGFVCEFGGERKVLERRKKQEKKKRGVSRVYVFFITQKSHN